jgi:hypothetical protein
MRKWFYDIRLWFLKRKLKKSAAKMADTFREYQKARPKKKPLTKEERAKQVTFLDKEMELLASICKEEEKEENLGEMADKLNRISFSEVGGNVWTIKSGLEKTKSSKSRPIQIEQATRKTLYS